MILRIAVSYFVVAIVIFIVIVVAAMSFFAVIVEITVPLYETVCNVKGRSKLARLLCLLI